MRKRLMLIAFFTILTVLAACGTDAHDEGEADKANNQENEVEEPSHEDSVDEGQIDDTAETPHDDEEVEYSNKENSDSDQSSDAEIVATGIFNGQADPHTVEIETDDGPTAFQLTIEARDLVEDIEVGDEVSYTCYEDGEQLVIESIGKTE